MLIDGLGFHWSAPRRGVLRLLRAAFVSSADAYSQYDPPAPAPITFSRQRVTINSHGTMAAWQPCHGGLGALGLGRNDNEWCAKGASGLGASYRRGSPQASQGYRGALRRGRNCPPHNQ